MDTQDPHPFFLDGAWHCALCGGRVTETTRRRIGVFTRPRSLVVFRVFGTCGDCSREADWTETRPPEARGA